MTMQTLFRAVAALIVASWIQTLSAAESPSAKEILEAYIHKAVSTVNEIYQARPDALERSSLIGQAGLNEYWLTSRQATTEAEGSGAAFAELLGFRPDNWTVDEFRQAGDFGEMAVEFSRTRTFRSGEQNTSTIALIFEMIKVEDDWFIAAFRNIEEDDTEVVTWDENPDSTNMVTEGIGPQDVVRAQLDLLQSLPPQALSSASEKSAPLWQDTREARKGLGRVIATVMTLSSFSPDPLVWRLSVSEQGPATAKVMAEAVSDKAMAFNGLMFELEKNGDQWLLSAAVATR
tara:strand:+ start:391316 stop:392185 length:870 start_codon:yes stop_codon:yes gene_type:complete